MDDQATQLRKRRARRWMGAAGLLAAGAIGGGALASTLSASAATSTPPASVSSAPARAGDDGAGRGGHGGPQPVRGDEKAVSASQAATLRAAALKAVPGATVYRVETDAGDGVYEAHVRKADGTLVTVKFDKDLKVTKVESGMGTGDPAPGGNGQPSAGA